MNNVDKLSALIKLRKELQKEEHQIMTDGINNILNFSYWLKNDETYKDAKIDELFNITTEQQKEINPQDNDFDVIVYAENQSSYEKLVYKIDEDKFIDYADSI